MRCVGTQIGEVHGLTDSVPGTPSNSHDTFISYLISADLSCLNYKMSEMIVPISRIYDKEYLQIA